VNAQTPESCGGFIKSSLPIAGNFAGFNFEYGHYGEGFFLLARNSTNYTGSQETLGASSSWISSQVAYGDPNVWYTMQLNVSSAPFRITTSVFDENGSSIGSLSTSDIYNFTFEDINYIGLSVWGYSPQISHSETSKTRLITLQAFQLQPRLHQQQLAQQWTFSAP
jgi:hypothetical protein